jgi:hypothetical protein
MRTLSFSGRIEDSRGGRHLVPEELTQVVVGPHVNRAPYQRLKLPFHTREAEQTRNPIWLELNKEIKVAVLGEVVS